MQTLLILCLLAPNLPGRVRGEARAGGSVETRSTTVSATQTTAATTVGDLRVNPTLQYVVGNRDRELTLTYSGRLRLRASPGALTPFGTNRFGVAGVLGGRPGGWRTTWNAQLTDGAISFDEMLENLGVESFGLASTGQTIPLFVTRGEVGTRALLTRRLSVELLTSLRLLSTSPVSARGLPRAEKPNLIPLRNVSRALSGELTTQLQPRAAATLLYALTRQDEGSVSARIDASASGNRSPYGAGGMDFGLKHAFFQAHQIELLGGGMVAGGASFFSAFPLASARYSGQWQHRLAGTFGWNALLSMDPFYDPFLQALTERGTTSVSMTASPLSWLSLSAGTRALVRLWDSAPGTTNRQGDSVVSVSQLRVAVAINPDLRLELGSTVVARFRSQEKDSRPSLATSSSSVQLFARITGGLGWEH